MLFEHLLRLVFDQTPCRQVKVAVTVYVLIECIEVFTDSMLLRRPRMWLSFTGKLNA